MKPLPWSYSALSSFKQCPKNYSEIKVYKRFQDTTNEKAKWGTYVHEEFEKALTRRDYPLPDNLSQYEPYLKSLRALPGVRFVEIKGGLNRKLESCDFFAKDVWVRTIIDYLVIDWTHEWAVVVDHKTGKSQYHDPRQLMLFALWVLYKFPKVRGVETRYAWLLCDNCAITKEVYMRHHIDDMWTILMPDLMQYVEAFKTETWQARESWKCGFCPVTDCQHWREPRK